MILYRGFIPLAVTILGTISLMFLHTKPNPADKVTALLFPPTTSATKIIDAILSRNLPIRDIRWNGRLVEIDLSEIEEERRINIARSLPILSLQISIDPTRLCIEPENLKDTR